MEHPDEAERSDPAEALLITILDGPEAEWQARLQAACAEHQTLADELVRRFNSLCESGMATAVGSEQFPGFRVWRRLGAGGMGVV